MNELIKAIEAEKYEFMVGEGVMESAHNYAMDKAIELINAHMEGKVIVPVEILKDLLDDDEQYHGETLFNKATALLKAKGEKA